MLRRIDCNGGAQPGDVIVCGVWRGGPLRRALFLGLAAALLACEPPHSKVVVIVNNVGIALAAVTVSVPSLALGAITNVSGRAELSLPAGVHTLRIGCLANSKSVAVTADGVADVEVTVECSPQSDKVVTDASSSELIALIDLGTDASGTATCQNDAAPLLGVGSLVVPGNATAADAANVPCHLAALVLANDRAPVYVTGAASISWTSALGDVVSVTMPTQRLPVPVRIVVSDPRIDTPMKEDIAREVIRNIHLGEARTVLQFSFAGISLVDDVNAAVEPQIVFAPSYAMLLGGGCSNAAAIRANAALYAPGRLNVYYLHEVVDEAGGQKAGYTCVSSDAPNIILMDVDTQQPNTLVHEVGHALGLFRPDWGHGEEYAGLYKDSSGQQYNVMAQGLPASPQYLSVGQVSQMHLNADSWLNRPSATDGSTLRGRFSAPTIPISSACTCPETTANPDCPAMNSDIARSGTVITSTAVKACTVTPATSAVSLCRGTSVDVSATFSQGGASTTRGNRMWVSLAPSILTVKDESSYFPANSMMKGRLTGVTAGTAVVRAYVDGSFAPITVTVRDAGTPGC